MEETIKIFSSLFKTKFPKETQKDILPFLKKKEFKKRSVLTKQGEVPTLFYILLSGVVRSLIIDDKGKEHIRNLFVPVTANGSLACLINKSPSDSQYDCLTECVVLECSFNEIRELTFKHHSLSSFYNSSLELSFIKAEERIYDLSVLNSTERYLKLKKQIPNIENLITQYHIASYLNITPVQLSRIRKELYSK